jgi:hypothetical protein
MKRAALNSAVAWALTVAWAFLGVPTASAVPVTSWSYVSGAGFTAFAPAGVTSLDNGSLGTPRRLQWGVSTGPGQSALQILEPNSGTIVTGGPSQLNITIVHENRPITGTTLTSATITGSLILTPILPSPPFPGPPIPFGLPFSIAFAETPNTAPCGFVSVSVCDDVFILTSPSFPLTFPFPFDGENYAVTLTVGALGALPALTCGQAGLPAGCFGLTTQENQSNTVPVNFTINTVPAIPEPSTILLLGSGLGVLALYARRKVGKKVKETA